MKSWQIAPYQDSVILLCDSPCEGDQQIISKLGEIFVKHISDKGLVFRIFSKTLKTQHKSISIRKWAKKQKQNQKPWTDISSRRISRWQISIWKCCFPLLDIEEIKIKNPILSLHTYQNG